MREEFAQPQIRPEDAGQLETADEDPAGIAAPVFEGPQNAIDGVIIELLQLVPVRPPEKGSQIGLVEYAPYEFKRVIAIAVDDVTGDGPNNFMQFRIVFGRRPVAAVDREIAGRVGA